ncbi:hypothetical protein EV11_1157 [Prochlorococcus sp. SS52]|nr:hypothetical protein EV04_0570 [Prochlorococcus marinus str. LG]KGG20747.1 hypothetical protein EV08_0951 [Prochlorococcus marinus str. SS2]KGG25148.1 hypothetical protein EV09_0042 [Prochlorococcus marinus str. SS35]KGG33300.1 hypothetical protein EV10_0507 [Prochlorococcus marinus str. SS51]KGG35593.1 hypothetical protein EV11_1157 [Prochlorococcus sp. SS52]
MLDKSCQVDLCKNPNEPLFNGRITRLEASLPYSLQTILNVIGRFNK